MIDPQAERIAAKFHEHLLRLDEKRPDSEKVAWRDLPLEDRNLMIAVVRVLLDSKVIATPRPFRSGW